ncbi:glutamate synthase large subunit [Candidatus Poriferisocius sp.]|uniref:glutamate synthase large subunit n=1 Tax=Candidatus Poriferisocius sp. TaxID=3101276 RepID=UPI003B014AB1
MRNRPQIPDLPYPRGLYDPSNEHDGCGVGFLVDLKGRPRHEIVSTGYGALCNLQHRGALGAEANTGDGAGLLIQIPDDFYRQVCEFDLPQVGAYATGIGFLPDDPEAAAHARAAMDAIAVEEGLTPLGWREVPTNPEELGAGALATMPSFWQPFYRGDGLDNNALMRRAYIVRTRIRNEVEYETDDRAETGALGSKTRKLTYGYFASLSNRTIVYKGMLTTPQLGEFYLDLNDVRVTSALAMIHSRFSTNTFPSWPLAHPYRFISHNGEINTVQGNRNWMRAREALLDSPHLPGNLGRLFPVCAEGVSDTATFDQVLELLYMGGYSLPQAVLMMIPEPWENHESMAPELRAFYRYYASLMEPWDGPADIVFSDGVLIGAVLDRNGLRPSRYWVTDDDLVIMASEVGVMEVDPAAVVEKGRLQPGRMFLIDTAEGRIVRDEEIKKRLAGAHPYAQWLADNQVDLDDLVHRPLPEPEDTPLLVRQQMFGYTHEELKVLLAPMARDGKEALGSMGTDTPVAVLSTRSRLLYDYFQQLFAQVTNPPLDAIREEIVTATCGWLGPEGNLLDPQPESCRQIFTPHPVITNQQLADLVGVDGPDGHDHWHTEVVPCLYAVDDGGPGLRIAIQRIREQVSRAIEAGKNIIVLSDRGSGPETAPIPSLLATAAIHHHLVREKTRTQVGLVVESGDAREVHHICLLLAYGATAINPYLAFETIDQMIDEGLHGFSPGDDNRAAAHRNYVKACDKGVLKVMSKMGISTVKSYVGAQIFEAIGLGHPIIQECFTGTVSRLGGIGFTQLAEEVRLRHRIAYPDNPDERAHRTLEGGGEYQWRREGEYHLFNPETVFKLQHATREGRYDIFKQYTEQVDTQSERLATLRGLFRFRTGVRQPVPIEEVEPVAGIVARFSTGAMSYGSISAEAHETLAIAMNRIGGKSNTGEGGEDPRRYRPDPNGDLRRSAIKQAASGRFGVTSEYLVNSDDIQIKMAQGAKPGEGGQLPGHKVWPWIAEVRHSTPGVGLISPPPHHDIYSIEDLAQLIHDLKNANPNARIHVKLVSELGVGTVAAGVSKAHADVVLISGHDGGTGASPLTSIKHAGTPWELGLAETQQTLLLNRLRDRIVVQTDGQLKTGRDVMIAALLGAEEFGFATAPLVVMGCIMMRVCHLDTCPVGVATQDPELRKKFTGRPEFVINFMEYIAEEVREILALLGFRTLAEAVGRVDCLDVSEAVDHWKASGLDLSPILYAPEIDPGTSLHCTRSQDHGLERALDQQLIAMAGPALEDGHAVELDLPISNVNRTVGTMLGHQVTSRWGSEGLPDNTIRINFTGSAGNSFGAFLPRGITLKLSGDANDYVGKGLSGGRIVVTTHPQAQFVAEQNVIAGNVIGYGATGGELFLRGLVGERFCVRNSGAIAVVEGVGDHGCEYMTGGRAVVLGPTGRNFGAGMSGGIAYVYDPEGIFPPKLNREMVDLDPLEDDDQQWLRDRINRHMVNTGSTMAERILANWATEVHRFVKVMPQDYKRILVAQAEAERTGADARSAIMAAAHG